MEQSIKLEEISTARLEISAKRRYQIHKSKYLYDLGLAGIRR
jgi:hypothetical protein